MTCFVADGLMVRCFDGLMVRWCDSVRTYIAALSDD